jgi:hypothetical protein
MPGNLPHPSGPVRLGLHDLGDLIMDNGSSHSSRAARARLAAHSRFGVTFTPKHAYWLNVIVRWFGFLADQTIRRGVHKIVQAFEATSAPGWRTGTGTPGRSLGPRPPRRSSIP